MKKFWEKFSPGIYKKLIFIDVKHKEIVFITCLYNINRALKGCWNQIVGTLQIDIINLEFTEQNKKFTD